MNLARIVAVFCLSILLIPHLAGQQEKAATPGLPISEVQPLALETMAADSAGAVLQIPNVFSPNGDQLNDYFVVTTDGTTVYKFSVFTRSGTRIYQSLSPSILWDGRSIDGKELKEGTYYYVIEENGGSNPFEKAGFMYLYR
ncbi:MAG: gliding motility-associated C-terminal domain-containing protein [Bacteroidia bacterium]|nr:MAG: gliding motility-associated C-terminal domain-containing protein [Bacteroidia bacterium]